MTNAVYHMTNEVGLMTNTPTFCTVLQRVCTCVQLGHTDSPGGPLEEERRRGEGGGGRGRDEILEYTFAREKEGKRNTCRWRIRGEACRRGRRKIM